MRLQALLEPGVTVHGRDWEAVEVEGLSADSRAIGRGAVFAAFAGSRTDGRRYVAGALARGAVAVLADETFAPDGLPVPLIVDPEPRRRLALMAARFYGRQPKVVTAVTGTNGKTSVAWFTGRLWRALGRPAATLGTLGLDAPGYRLEGGLTTPDPVRLHELLAELARQGVDHLALEASSHGLAQYRLDGVHIAAAAFTNLSRDHFDYHGSGEAYFAAKRRLFSDLLEPGGRAVLNADQPQYRDLKAVCERRGIEVLDYGRSARRIRLVEQVIAPEGQTLEVAVDGLKRRVRTPLLGPFQADNLLAAVGLVLGCGADPEAALERLGALGAPPGRLERAAATKEGAPVIVDYAHTPDALDRALVAVRAAMSGGRLSVVFGCGGDRDPGKRLLMGEIAAERADRVIVTDDNPRNEDPAQIRRAIIMGCPGAEEIGDRRTAIWRAIADLREGDALLIAGKGHESGQIVGAAVLPFDDALEARAAVAARTEARS